MSGVPFGSVPQDTGEYMLGDVLVTVVLFESDGTTDVSSEDWNELVRDQNGAVVLDEFGRTTSVNGPNLIEQAKDRVRGGLTWWEDTLSEFYRSNYTNQAQVHSLNFQYDFQHAHNPIATGYEPIARRSNDYAFWVDDFLDAVGYNTFASIDTDIRTFNHDQRVKSGADWAYTIFVVNDQNDLDGRFAPGGSFSRAFAFSGGRFLISPAGRPASTFAHETGHIFWARDEYEFSGGSYIDHRGYYNSQNWNAWDNPAPGFVQQPSIMDAGTDLDVAFATHTSSDSSLAMIGWKDSDGDGIFDVLDVPLTLTGSGHFDAALGQFRFFGHSEVRTLPDRNSSGLQNDITINEVSLAEYSVDQGSTWIASQQFDAYQVDLDLAIPMTIGQELLIRTRSLDPLTGQTVAVSDTTFAGRADLPTSADQSGVQGFVFHDQDDNHAWTNGEKGLAGWTMRLVDPLNQPITVNQVLEPDDYLVNQLLNNVLNGVTLSAIGYDVKDDRVGAVTANTASTGQMVFGYVKPGTADIWSPDWTTAGRMLRVDFDTPTTAVSLDAVARNRNGYGRLEIYDSNDRLLARYTTGLLQGTAFETMALSRPTADISYAIARSTMQTSIRLDHLRVGPEATAVTDAQGAYTMPSLVPGTYRVQAVPPLGWAVTDPLSGVREVVVGTDGKMQWDPAAERPSDFFAQTDTSAFPWRNPINPLDVDDNGLVQPLDALVVINALNAGGGGPLPPPNGNAAPPPYYDTTGDNLLTPLDALLVINHLNGGGDPGNGGGGAGGGLGGGGGEGEFSALSAGHSGSVPSGEKYRAGISDSGRAASDIPIGTTHGAVVRPVMTHQSARRPTRPPESLLSYGGDLSDINLVGVDWNGPGLEGVGLSKTWFAMTHAGEYRGRNVRADRHEVAVRAPDDRGRGIRRDNRVAPDVDWSVIGRRDLPRSALEFARKAEHERWRRSVEEISLDEAIALLAEQQVMEIAPSAESEPTD